MRRAAIGERPRPKYVVWEITLACDMACGHCGSRAGKARTRELTTAEALSVVQQLAELGTEEITLIGGEAYLRDDFPTLARAIVDAGMRCGMTTAARGFGAEQARAARQAGMAAISISLDGLRAAHDRQRVLGSFDRARAAMVHVRDAGLGLNANTQLNRLSVPDLDGLLDLLIAEGAQGWQLQMTVPMGRAAENHEWLLQPPELLELYPRLAALAERGRAAGVAFWPANNLGYFGPHESTLRNRGAPGQLVWNGCNAGVYALGIEADGSIKGCPSLPTASYVGGNVRERSLRQIWDETRELAFMRADAQQELWGFCQSCYYARECRGGCTWTAHTFFGRPGNNPYCHHRALEHAARGLSERLVPIQAPPGRPFDHGKFEIVVEPQR
ncbi:MAG: SPASM domain-containing protein [Polyangiaceae bacterium]|nr:SPASM domain-containing protein [Polyangiaceae bacterium]